jgi:hypothetical protein
MNDTLQENHKVKSIKETLINKGWDSHHIDQVEYWLYQYYLNDEYDNANNLRFARSWVPTEVKEYDKKQKNGCCGSIDDGLSTMEGGTIRVGFNYGH